MTVDELRFVSYLDAMHDFTELKASGNQFYMDYVAQIRKPLSMKNVNIESANIEDQLLTHFKINDGALALFDINKMKFESASVDSDKFKVVVPYDFVYTDTFKIWLSTLLHENTGSLDFITDTTNISEDVMCSMEFGETAGKVVVTDATVFDRGTTPQLNNCKYHDPAEITITKQEGWLTSLQQVGVKNNTFSYILNDGTHSSFHLDDYLKAIIVSKARGIEKKLPFYVRLINELVSSPASRRQLHGGAGQKRKFANILEELLEELQRRYKVPEDLCKQVLHDKDSKARRTLAYMLFDLKGAGDRLQIKYSRRKHANTHGTTLISNDRVSAVFAYMTRKHCIRTALTDGLSARTLTFLNMQVNVDDFKVKLTENYLIRFDFIRNRLESYIEFVRTLKDIPDFFRKVNVAYDVYNKLLTVKINRMQGASMIVSVDQLKWIAMHVVLSLLKEFAVMYEPHHKKDLYTIVQAVASVRLKIAEMTVDEKVRYLSELMVTIEKKRYFKYLSSFRFDNVSVLEAFGTVLEDVFVTSRKVTMDVVQAASKAYDKTSKDLLDSFPCLSGLCNLIEGSAKRPWITIPYMLYQPEFDLKTVVQYRGIDIVRAQYAKIMDELRASPCWPSADTNIEEAVLQAGGAPAFTILNTPIAHVTPTTQDSIAQSSITKRELMPFAPQLAQASRMREIPKIKATKQPMHHQARHPFHSNHTSITQLVDLQVYEIKQDIVHFKNQLAYTVCEQLRARPPSPPPAHDNDEDDLKDPLVELILVFLIKTTPVEVLLIQLQELQHIMA